MVATNTLCYVIIHSKIPSSTDQIKHIPIEKNNLHSALRHPSKRMERNENCVTVLVSKANMFLLN